MKLAIVGSEPKTRGDAPFLDPEYQIWVFNEAAQAEFWCRRWDVLFQMHKPEIYSSPYNLSNKSHWDWLQQRHGKPIYMIAEDPRVPDSIRYPLDKIQALLPELPRDYFELSAAYALLLAVLEFDFDEIHIYGMDLVSNTEYIYQADCFRSWLMWCWGRGEKVILHGTEGKFGLFGSHKYGYDGEVNLPLDLFRDRVQSYAGSYHAANKNYENIKKSFLKAVENKDYNRVLDLTMGYKEAAMRAGEYAGREAEAKRYADAGERPIYRNDFEKRAAQCNAEMETLNNDMFTALGKLEYVFNVFKLSGDVRAAQQVLMFAGEMTKLAYDLGAHLGGFQEVMEYIGELDKLIQAAGGRKSVEVVSMHALESVKEKVPA